MKKSIATLLVTIASLFAGIAHAQTPPPAADMAEAEVRRVDKDAKKVTLRHGPIKSLDMPPMTMVFQVRDPAIMEQLAVGQKILFTAEQQQGAYVVTGVRRADAK